MQESKTTPIIQIGYYGTDGNPYDYIVGQCGVTRIDATEVSGEYSNIPWVEVFAGDRLLARFNQHKLEHIFYHDRNAESVEIIQKKRKDFGNV